ncbi:MAG: CopD family protein [Burkholderiaceae bacterium]|jgi:putative membrane protein|nr:CopD family protein [Burkholderiaceae bacterium]MBU6291845.1 CopD family protein [Burkholderiales bacterium]NCV85189.1 CopD family protein [Oxalobacteraceae bacterium]NCW86400.1 CopD family protein [Oxalobacteraceae bacterium]
MAYLWIKALHIVFIASWFAGLFYLPRIFVNLAMETEQAAIDRLLLMSRKLYRFMTILMIPALVLGLILWLYYGTGVQTLWMHVKLIIVLLLIAYHHLCKRLLSTFERGENTRSHIWYRWFNEIPVIGMIIAVVLVVLKPL